MNDTRYVIVGDESRPLPIGSTLDQAEILNIGASHAILDAWAD